jgi:ribosomal protein L7Ae-like RNA K-turn-binding protein
MIARKAGKLMLGFDMVSEALKTGKADASERTKKEVLFLMKRTEISVPCYTLTEYTKEALGHSLGKMTAVLAVCDEGFSGQIAKLVSD